MNTPATTGLLVCLALAFAWQVRAELDDPPLTGWAEVSFEVGDFTNRKVIACWSILASLNPNS